MNIWVFAIGWIITGVLICVALNDFGSILFNVIICILVSTILFLTGLGHF